MFSEEMSEERRRAQAANSVAKDKAEDPTTGTEKIEDDNSEAVSGQPLKEDREHESELETAATTEVKSNEPTEGKFPSNKDLLKRRPY